MFNHARTLLMNIDGSNGVFNDYPGDELIPESYQQLELPTYLDVFRSRLFGASPDRGMLNYRAAQLLTMIEATELQQFVLELDSRITYSSHPRQLALPTTFQPRIRSYGTGSTDILTVIGKPISPDVTGITRYDFELTISGSTLEIQRLSPPVQSKSELIELTDGLSQAITLPLSGYKVRVNTDTDGLQWRIDGFLRPTADLNSIERNLHSVGEPYLLELFGTQDTEPFNTFRNCWKNHPEFVYRLGGLVLAMIYRTEEIRNA